MVDEFDITTGGIAYGRLLTSVILATVVLSGAIAVEAGGALAASGGPATISADADADTPRIAVTGDDDGHGEDGLAVDRRETTEEHVVVAVTIGDSIATEDVQLPDDVVLGHADRFVVNEDDGTVSLPDHTEGLARPVAIERLDEDTFVMTFRTDALDLPADPDEEVTLGLGLFPERTVPLSHWATCPGHRDY